MRNRFCDGLFVSDPALTVMLARRTLSRAPSALSGAGPGNARNMATLREIELRLKSVKNIEKITKSMKMIASTQLTKAQRAMAAGKQYGIANSGACCSPLRALTMFLNPDVS
jgi:hypothetical protein